MSIHYDDKGKFYTDLVSKEGVLVTIQTIDYRIEGTVFTRPDKRLKDELNQESDYFIAVKDALISDKDGFEIQKTEFLMVNRDHIVWLIPENKE